MDIGCAVLERREKSIASGMYFIPVGGDLEFETRGVVYPLILAMKETSSWCEHHDGMSIWRDLSSSI